MKYLLKILKKYRLMSKLRQDMDLYYRAYFASNKGNAYAVKCFVVTQKALRKLQKL